MTRMATKKITFAAAFAGCALMLASVASAQITDVVYSVNIVGFQKVTSPAGGLRITSTPFLDTAQDVNTVIGPQGTGNIDPAFADNIVFYDPIGQQFKSVYLLDNNAGIPPQLHFKWFDGAAFAAATNEIPPGTAFWYQSNAGANQDLVFVGDVVDDASASINIFPGLQLISYPFSTRLGVNAMDFVNDGAVGNIDPAFADNLIFFDPASQQFKSVYLLDNNAGIPPQLHFKWFDGAAFAESTNVIETGQGIWYQHAGAGFTWTENRPYAIP